LENLGKCELSLTLPMKTKAGLIMITKLARKYLYGTKVFSAKHSPAIGLLAPSQRYSTIEGEEVCQLRPEKK
jgi:hypothetical protein